MSLVLSFQDRYTIFLFDNTIEGGIYPSWPPSKNAPLLLPWKVQDTGELFRITCSLTPYIHIGYIQHCTKAKRYIILCR